MYNAITQELLRLLAHIRLAVPKKTVWQSMRWEMSVMGLLCGDCGEMTTGDISRHLGVSMPRIAILLNAMEKKKLIDRRRDDDDRRRVIVRITQIGRDFFLDKKKVMERCVCDVVMMIGEEDARECVRLLRRLHEVLPAVIDRHLQAEDEQEERYEARST